VEGSCKRRPATQRGRPSSGSGNWEPASRATRRAFREPPEDRCLGLDINLFTRHASKHAAWKQLGLVSRYKERVITAAEVKHDRDLFLPHQALATLQ
jgi:hypothetical protein